MSYNDNRDSGGVVISNDVIASIAANAVKDVDGFGSFSSALRIYCHRHIYRNRLARLRCGALIMILKFSFYKYQKRI